MTISPRRVVVIGCGRQGSLLAAHMDSADWRVAVVDRDATAFALLPDHLAGSCVTGDALQPNDLTQAAISEAHSLIATTAQDNRNVLIAAISRASGARHAIARVRDPQSAEFECLGIETVCPTLLEARVLLRHIEGVVKRRESLHMVVAGCGRLGSHLATSLGRAGHELVVVDRNDAAFEGLRTAGFSGVLLEGDATEPSVLRKAGIEKVDLLVAVIRDDSVNLMVALLAKMVFGVEQVLARVCDPQREAMYRGLALTTVCPTALGGAAILGLVDWDPRSSESAGLKIEDGRS